VGELQKCKKRRETDTPEAEEDGGTAIGEATREKREDEPGSSEELGRGRPSYEEASRDATTNEETPDGVTTNGEPSYGVTTNAEVAGPFCQTKPIRAGGDDENIFRSVPGGTKPIDRRE
jgi:hypothetical protein